MLVMLAPGSRVFFYLLSEREKTLLRIDKYDILVRIAGKRFKDNVLMIYI